jgi:hypothetical protein
MPLSPRTGLRLRAAAPFVLAAACHAASLAGLPDAAFAQPKPTKSSTTSLIQRGAALFDDQQYEESIQTLSAALVRPGTTEAEKTEIYRLLAYNYIILKRTEEADAAVRGLYVINEKFSLPPTESPRLRDFFEATRRKWTEEGKPGRVTAAVIEKPIKMQHSSPAEGKANASLKLSGTIEDPDARVRGVQLAYRTGAKGKFVTVAATYTLGEFHATIPGLAAKPPLLEYYLQGIDKGGLPLVSRGDAGAPLRVVVPKESSVASSPFLWVPVGLAVAGGIFATTYFLTRPKGAGSGGNTSSVIVGIRE